jgi:hypothetical protein
MGNRKPTKRPTPKRRPKVADLTPKNTKNVKGGTMGTAAGFIPGGGVISASISNAK